MSNKAAKQLAEYTSKTSCSIPGITSAAAKLLGACLILLLSMAASAYAQETGVSAGGKWTEFAAEDRMTAAKKARFELPANDTADSDDRAKIILFCTDGKLNLADFRPNARIAPPNRPGFWGQPQMEVTVRVDNAHSYHGWNWVNGNFLAMDKGTTRELLGAQLFRIEFGTPNGPEIAEFSPTGLNLDRISKACGLTPKKP